MVDLAMSIFEFLTKFLVFWHPWVCIHSDLKPLFETDMSDSSYCVINYKIFRYNSDDIQDAVANHEFTEGKKVKIVHKTVQAWLPEADFKKPDDLR